MAVSGQFLTSIQTTLLPIYLEKKLLETLDKNLQLYNLTPLKRSVPRGMGTTMVFNQAVHIAAQTTALSESLTPAQVQMSAEIVSAAVKVYGAFTVLSELSKMSMIDVTWVNDELAYNAALTIDTLIRNEFNASASGIGTPGTTSAAMLLTGGRVQRAVTRLRNLDVPGLFGDSMALVCHPNALYDVMSDTATAGWVDLVKQSGTPDADKLATRGLVGEVFGARVFQSTNVFSSADGSAGLTGNVYRNQIFGRNAYAVVRLSGPEGGNLANPQVIVKDLGSAGTEDPLNMRSSIGWKAIFAPLFLKTTTDAGHGAIVYTGVTAI